MAKVFIEETTLTAIGDAIREKTGGTNLIAPGDMATEIGSITTGGGGEEYFTDEELIFTDNVSYLFAFDKWQSILEKERNRIIIKDVSDISSILRGVTGVDYSFLIIDGMNSTKSNINGSYLFYNCPNVEKLPRLKNITLNTNLSAMLIYGCNMLKDEEVIEFYKNIKFSNSGIQTGILPSYCYSLRNIDAAMPYFKEAMDGYSQGVCYNSSLTNLYGLDEINGIPVLNGVRTYNGFSSAFGTLPRAKNVTFETDNGVPIVARWKSQIIDLYGYGNGIGFLGNRTSAISYVTGFNSGITADKEVIDDATYQALKNDPDWFTADKDYARYNHDSAVATINSLPDTSAYLATAGGTNTIKFQGNQGSKTDGGAINTLTDAEIAVATAKGWTVTFA